MPSTLTRANTAIIRPQSYVNAATVATLQTQLMEAVSSPQEPIVLVDMAQVEFLDSAGLMTLVHALRLAQKLERRLVLCSVSPSIRIILELAQLDQVFEIFANTAELEATFA